MVAKICDDPESKYCSVSVNSTANLRGDSSVSLNARATVLALMPSSRLNAAVVACASRDHAAHNPVSQWIAVLLL